MSRLGGFANVVFPARDLQASVAAWTVIVGQEPVFQSDDFAAFRGDGVDIGLTALPWVDEPLVFWKVDDIDEVRRALVDAGATPMGEVEDGSLAPLGSAEIANGDPATGIVDVPGGRLAVVRASDSSLVGLSQEVPMA